MQKISLRKMIPSEFNEYKARSIPGYAEDLSIALDLDAQAALAHATKQFDQMLPQGSDTPGHEFFAVEDASGVRVGELWLQIRDSSKTKAVFICDIALNETHRGKGLGKELLGWVESYAKERSMTRVALHVFGHNERAATLYRRLGYRATSIQMRKDL